MLTTGIIETALYVDDMQRSVEFYQRVLGFQTLAASERLTALRVSPGQVLLIMKKGLSSEPSVMSFGVIPPSDAAGSQHVAFGARPDQIGEWRELLRHHGIGIESELDWPEGGQSLYFTVFTDLSTAVERSGSAPGLGPSEWDEQWPTSVSGAASVRRACRVLAEGPI